MSQIVFGNHALNSLEDQLEHSKTSAMKPLGIRAKIKFNADYCMHIAAQNQIYTKISGLHGRMFSNPPGRIAALIKRALPHMVEHATGHWIIRAIAIGWRAEVGRAYKQKRAPHLHIYMGQIEALKELAEKSAQVGVPK